MKAINNLVYVTCFILFAGGCGQKTLKPKDFIKWVNMEGNGLTVKQNVQGTEFLLQYKPVEYMALMETGIEKTGLEDFNKVLKEYDGLEYYLLKVKKPRDFQLAALGEEGQDDGGFENARYLSFGMQENVRLATGADTLKCVLYQFEQDSGASPFLTFSLGFEAPKEKMADRNILLEDKLFTNQLISLKIEKQSLAEIPELQL